MGTKADKNGFRVRMKAAGVLKPYETATRFMKVMQQFRKGLEIAGATVLEDLSWRERLALDREVENIKEQMLELTLAMQASHSLKNPKHGDDHVMTIH